jgi:hypothetical protein
MSADELLAIRADEEAATEILAMLASPGIEPAGDPWNAPFARAAGAGPTRWNRL